MKGENTVPNCRSCKQLIYESYLKSEIDIVIVMKKNGKYIQKPISSLMMETIVSDSWERKQKNKAKITLINYHA